MTLKAPRAAMQADLRLWRQVLQGSRPLDPRLLHPTRGDRGPQPFPLAVLRGDCGKVFFYDLSFAQPDY